MTSTLSKFIVFAAGMTLGAVVAWKVADVRYKQILHEEIDSVKNAYSERYASDESVEPDINEAESDPEHNLDMKQYAAVLSGSQYTNYTIADDKATGEVKDMEKPYVISPEEFGELYDYATVSLTYYADNVLADDQDIPIEDVDGVVGLDSLTHFGEYEDDSVFVRNDKVMTDYEILLDPRKYSDVTSTNPHRAEG